MSNTGLQRVGVIGAGGWGTALAITAHRAGNDLVMWSRSEGVVEMIQRERINAAYLPGSFIDPEIIATTDLEFACHDSNLLVLAVPAQHLRAVCVQLSDMVDAKTPLVVASKGIERGSLALMHEVVSAILPNNPVALLSGPNFAREVAEGLPTATTIACPNREVGPQLVHALGGKYFRPYWTDDLVGAEIGGAVKNVIAIATGVAAGRGYGENARAALVTRGLAEMVRLCEAKGGRASTLMGLCGIGDLMLTCSSATSRNYQLGQQIGQGAPLEELMTGRRLAEGVATAESTIQLAAKLDVAMPLCMMVYRILYKQLPVGEAIDNLLKRPFTAETSGSSLPSA